MITAPLEISENNKIKNIEQNSRSRFPRSIVSVNREEFVNAVPLTIRDRDGNRATLPADLYGHFFLTGPAGAVNSPVVEGDESVVLSSNDGWTALLNGDGMVYRFSFHEGQASLKTRLMKPPCYYADLATADKSKSDLYQGLEFNNLGISRSSFNKLGIRNQLNTNFVPFKLPEEESDRLLITWDAGRPYEIDPETLELLSPVGKNQDWEDLLPYQPPLTFKSILTSAHPVFDKDNGAFYTLNIGKSISTLIAFRRALEERIAENHISLQSIIDDKSFQGNLIKLYSLILGLLNLLTIFLGGTIKIFKKLFGGYDFVRLLAWDGKEVGIKHRWNIVLPGNRPLKIDQTVHQMGITKDYIVFAETAFKFSMEFSLPYQIDALASTFKVFLANFINYPQLPITKLYIIKKADLKIANQNDNSNTNSLKNIPNIVAQEVEIAPEFSHFTVDYDNPDNQIVLYVSHVAATDIAEYIRDFDRSAFNDFQQDSNDGKFNDPEFTFRLQNLRGAVVSPLDISRLGRWVIDAETGKVIDKQLFPDEEDKTTINQQLVDNQLDTKFQLTWCTAFYVCQDRRPTNKFTDVFWNSWGAWPDTLTTRTVRSYENHPNRLVDINNVIDLTYQGVPSSLCHLKVRTDSENKTTIEIDTDNYYQFNNHYLGTSAQYLPRLNAEDQTDGYIACLVLTSDEYSSQSDREDNDPEWSQNTEIWIFDARKLNQGPLYKLSHPRLNIGITSHTTWIPEAKSPSSHLDYDVREDYEYLVEQVIGNRPELGDKIRRLFDEEIYPHF